MLSQRQQRRLERAAIDQALKDFLEDRRSCYRISPASETTYYPYTLAGLEQAFDEAAYLSAGDGPAQLVIAVRAGGVRLIRWFCQGQAL